MNPDGLLWLGIAILLATVLLHRILFEQNLRLLNERERYWWLDGFVSWRIVGTAVPVVLILATLLSVWLVPQGDLWIIVGCVCSLLVFALLWQYGMVRRSGELRFAEAYVRRSLWLLAATQAGLVAGLGLIAFALVSRKT